MDSWLSTISVVDWLTRPSIAVWAGVIAAIIAAMTVEPKTWFKSPSKSVRRASQVAVVWLAVVCTLCFVASVGGNRGTGGQDQTEGAAEGAKSVAAPVVVGAGQFPPSIPENADLLIRFAPSAADQEMARNFSCDLYCRDAEKRTTRSEIRASNMDEFERLLVRQLRELKLAAAAESPIVQISRSPFPGENVLRKVRDKIRTAYPKATVQFDESNVP